MAATMMIGLTAAGTFPQMEMVMPMASVIDRITLLA
jgi:pyruvate kinase